MHPGRHRPAHYLTMHPALPHRTPRYFTTTPRYFTTTRATPALFAES